MIRKQFYLAPEQQKKLHRLARAWRCSEAEVLRRAIDRLPEPAREPATELEAILMREGLLAPPPSEDLPTGEEAAALERELQEWLQTRTEPLGLSEAVMKDRR